MRAFQNQGYVVSSRREDQEGSSLALLQLGERRALLRFLWGRREWGEDQVRLFRDQMDDLKAVHGYLVTNGVFSFQAQETARLLAVGLTDGSALRDILFRTAPPLHRLGSPEEKPLPFAKYIPWFVGISLVVIALIVLVLVSIALSMVPVPEA